MQGVCCNCGGGQVSARCLLYLGGGQCKDFLEFERGQCKGLILISRGVGAGGLL